MTRKLTEKEQLFLDVLFDDECKGKISAALAKAGYAPSTREAHIRARLNDEILEATKRYVVSVAPQAAYNTVDLLSNPHDPGAKIILAAANSLLDRANVVKSDKVEVSHTGGLFILPPKDEN